MLLVVDNLSLSESLRLQSRNTNDRTFSSIFLFRITLAAIISSNRNLFTLKLYKKFLWPIFFSMKACKLCNLLISRYPALYFGNKLQVTTFFSVANPLILCALPQIFIVAERTRSDLTISLRPPPPPPPGPSLRYSTAHSGVTTSKSNLSLVPNLWLLFTFQITLRRSGAIG